VILDVEDKVADDLEAIFGREFVSHWVHSAWYCILFQEGGF
jgi:hypothetical protein